jgi:hypothetical protein
MHHVPSRGRVLKRSSMSIGPRFGRAAVPVGSRAPCGGTMTEAQRTGGQRSGPAGRSTTSRRTRPSVMWSGDASGRPERRVCRRRPSGESARWPQSAVGAALSRTRGRGPSGAPHRAAPVPAPPLRVARVSGERVPGGCSPPSSGRGDAFSRLPFGRPIRRGPCEEVDEAEARTLAAARSASPRHAGRALARDSPGPRRRHL